MMLPGLPQLGKQSAAAFTALGLREKCHQDTVGPHASASWAERSQRGAKSDLHERGTEVYAAKRGIERFADARVGINVGRKLGLRVPEVIHRQGAVPSQVSAQRGNLFQHDGMND